VAVTRSTRTILVWVWLQLEHHSQWIFFRCFTYVTHLFYSVEILGLDLDATNVENGFVTLMTLIAEAKVILAFAGSTIAFKNLQDAAMLLDISRPLLEVRLDHPQPPLPGNEVRFFV